LTVDSGAGVRVDLTSPAAAGRVATITLDRPDRMNAQTPRLWQALHDIRRTLPGDVRVVVLRGAGRAFSAGLDRALLQLDAAADSTGGDADEFGILALPRLPEAEATARIAGWQDAFDWSSRPDLVSIAAVHGHAIGGGFQLALGCDIRILTDDAQLTMAEPSLGIVPDLGGTKRLVDLVGYSRAVEICLTGRRVPADEALQIGLASHVVAHDDLDATIERTVTALLAVDRDAAAETKALLAGASGRSQADQQAAERAAQYRRLRALAGFAE
jgi:enoyl-CoA hydratase/carnithine racemase